MEIRNSSSSYPDFSTYSVENCGKNLVVINDALVLGGTAVCPATGRKVSIDSTGRCDQENCAHKITFK